MHYIRFLKSPFVGRRRIGLHLYTKITITTDLGESFLCFDLPILVILLDHAGNHAQVHPYQWTAGKRELEISFSLPLAAILSGQRPRWPCRLLVRPRDSDYQLGVLGDLLLPSSQEHPAGVIMPVLSEQFSGEFSPNDQFVHPADIWPVWENQRSSILQIYTPKRVARQICMAGGDEFYIWEETGESIARHIWSVHAFYRVPNKFGVYVINLHLLSIVDFSKGVFVVDSVPGTFRLCSAILLKELAVTLTQHTGMPDLHFQPF